MKKLFDFIYWELSLFLLKISIPTFLISYLGIYPLLGYKVYYRWGYYEPSVIESVLWIIFGFLIIIYSFEIFKKFRIKEFELFFNLEQKNDMNSKDEYPLIKDPIEKLLKKEKKKF